MPDWAWIALAAMLLVYVVFVVGLIAAGRHRDARALAGLIPDCFVLFKRLLGDPRVRRRHKLLVVAMLGYLVLPFDLVPDFIPTAGQLDDAIVVGLVLRAVLRGAGEAPVREHWPGPQRSLRLIMRLAGSRA